MEVKGKFYVRLKPATRQHSPVAMSVENYFPVAIIGVRKLAMMGPVQIVPYYQKIVKHVLVERASWTIKIEHHVLIRYVLNKRKSFWEIEICFRDLVTHL